jgi:hypothetical protein
MHHVSCQVRSDRLKIPTIMIPKYGKFAPTVTVTNTSAAEESFLGLRAHISVPGMSELISEICGFLLKGL